MSKGLHANRLVRATIIILWISSLIRLAAAQDQKAPQETLRAAANLVQVPVMVQVSGKHLSGLVKENFAILQDGEPQPIASFEEIHAKLPERAALGQTFENTSPGQFPSHITVIAIDTVNTPPLELANLHDELKRYLLDPNTAGEPIGLMTLTRHGVHVLRHFTTDRQSLLADVQESTRTLPATHNEVNPGLREAGNAAVQQVGLADDALLEDAEKQFNTIAGMQDREVSMLRFQDRSVRIDSLFALQQLAQALKGIPGRKTLLWVGSGFQFLGGFKETKGITGYSYELGKIGEAIDQQSYTWKLLNDANIAVYPIDTRGTVNAAYQAMDPSVKYSPLKAEKDQAYQRDRETVETFKAIASETGGKPCIYRTDLRNCIREAVDDGQAYYLLGFYSDKKHSAPGWHRLTVKVDQKASVHHRSGFIITQEVPESKRMTDLQLALNSPYAYTSLPFIGRFLPATGAGERKTVSFQLHIPADSLTIDGQEINFDVVAVARGFGGKEVTRLGQHIQKKVDSTNIAEIKANGMNYRNKLELPPGEYGIWFVLRDNPTGRTGSVTVPLKL